MVESCSRQLQGWADHLQNLDIKGQRDLNEKSRQRYQTGKKAEEFMQELQDRLPSNHLLRKKG